MSRVETSYVTPVASLPTTTRSSRALRVVAPSRTETSAAITDGFSAPPPSIPTRMPLAPAVPEGPFGEEFMRTIDEISGLPGEPASGMTPLRDGRTAWETRLRLVREAQCSIVMSSYFLHPDQFSVTFVAELVEAARRGVQVVLCLDDFAESMAGPTYPQVYRDAIASSLRELEAAGGFVSWYANPDQQLHFAWGNGNHFKAMVVDGDRAIFGGRNIGSQYFDGARWTDFEMLLEGPIVQRIEMQIFEVASHGDVMLRRVDAESDEARRAISRRYSDTVERLRQEASRALVEGRTAMANAAAITGEEPPMLHMIYSDPTFGLVDRDHGVAPEQSPVTAALIEAINRAEHSITVSSNYLNGDEALIQALENAAKRGVRVDVIATGTEPSTGMAYVIYSGMAEYFFPRLYAAGVHIHETTTQEHGKMLLIDDTLAGWGSYNLELCSDESLVEAYMMTTNRAIVETVRHNLQDTIDHRSTEWQPHALSFWDELTRFFLKLFAMIIRPFL